MYFNKMMADEFKSNHAFTFKDFIAVCDTLKLTVFEIKTAINPFTEPHRIETHNMFENMSNYRATMPDWSARNYDYENDRVTNWLTIPEVKTGVFDLHCENNSTDYMWHFEIVGNCVVVHYQIQFMD